MISTGFNKNYFANVIRHAVRWHLDIQFYVLNLFSIKMLVSSIVCESIEIMMVPSRQIAVIFPGTELVSLYNNL